MKKTRKLIIDDTYVDRHNRFHVDQPNKQIHFENIDPERLIRVIEDKINFTEEMLGTMMVNLDEHPLIEYMKTTTQERLVNKRVVMSQVKDDELYLKAIWSYERKKIKQ